MSGLASIVLVFHIFICIALIGVVLLQRSEGGALGIGGGAGSFMSARGAGNALTRATVILAAIFFATSVILSVLSRSPTKELNLQGAHAKLGTLKPGQAPAPVSLAPNGSKPATAPTPGIPTPISLQPTAPATAPAGAPATIPAPVSLQPSAPAGATTEPAPSAPQKPKP